MRYVKQRILADPMRGDGHDSNGNPGDCLRACGATLVDVPYERVPHFGQHVSWWDLMRRWARARGGDFACVETRDGSVRYAFYDEPGLLIGSGPSPRGNFRHVVVVDADLDLVHDPHPSNEGLLGVDEVFAFCSAYFPGPNQLALTGAT